VDAVIETLAPLLTELTVIFGKSTVPVGTAKRVGARARELAPAGDDVEVAWNPEFLREGFAMRDTLHPVVRSRAIIYGRNCFGPHQW
jgi:UDPglucose 6-dehydrogenase